MARKWNLSNPDHIFIDKDRRQILDKALSGGAMRSIMEHGPFALSKQLRGIDANTKKGNKSFDVDWQMESWKSVWKDPLTVPFLMCISSAPTDTLAKMVATRLFLRAIDKNKGGKSPRWHNIFGGIGHDVLRDNKRNPAIPFLVLNNVTADSTNYKIEKLRDILTRYDGIPRVVVTSDLNPFEFMTKTVKMTLNFGLYMGASSQQRWSPED